MRCAAGLVPFFRHAAAIILLPFTVTVLVPVWIARRYAVVPEPGRSLPAVMIQAAGIALFLTGVALFVATLRRFAGEGRGTLAPWDPPRHLVIRGPYRFVRNPMISGVLLMLAGEACALRSEPHAIWAALFLVVNLLYIPLFEEPGLRRRFGESYRIYCRYVPRLVPRLTPWTPDAGGPGA